MGDELQFGKWISINQHKFTINNNNIITVTTYFPLTISVNLNPWFTEMFWLTKTIII